MIDEFGIAGYRSFGPEMMYIGPFGKLNLFVGPNNAGKSNILRFIASHLAKARDAARNQNEGLQLQGVDLHAGLAAGDVRVAFGVDSSGESWAQREAKFSPAIDKPDVKTILNSKPLLRGTPIAFFEYEDQNNRLTLSSRQVASVLEEGLQRDGHWSTLWNRLTEP